ncbi:MAG: helix-turn-helix domain-containing protein [Flavobacterium sp.]
MKFLTYCFIFLISLHVFPQKKDVLSNEEYLQLQDKTRAYFNSNIDSSFFYVNKIEKSANIIHKAFASGVKGYLFSKSGDFNSAEKYYKRALQLIKEAPKSYSRTQNEAYIYNYGGIIDRTKGNLSEALDKYSIAKKLSESIDDIVQIVKINNNIALVNNDIGNYKKAISATRQSDNIINTNKHLYSDSQYLINKSNVSLNLGVYYEKYFQKSKGNNQLLDSAFYYFNRTLIYSDDILENKLKAQKYIGNIYFFKKNIIEAEKAYSSVLAQAKNSNFEREYDNANFNLGFLKYDNKQFDMALVYFHKVDSIYKLNKMNYLDYIQSNYYQAKIYEAYGDSDKALEYSKIYLDNFEINEVKKHEDALEINYKISNQDSKKEMHVLQNVYKNKVLFKNGSLLFFSFLFVALLILLGVNNKRRKRAEQKVAAILEEYQFNLITQKSENTNSSTTKTPLKEAEKEVKEIASISHDNEKTLLAKLKVLEDKLFYLKPEFTQQEVAKKIKTNTTYLSYVVNKNYNKSFSVYYNELRIAYVINQIINNTRYREYTTQAIAESAGFKNADSFSSSFKKKTGVTPYQFINEIKKRELN